MNHAGISEIETKKKKKSLEKLHRRKSLKEYLVLYLLE